MRAEPGAIVGYEDLKKQRRNILAPAYSLAYDWKTNQCKAACGDCKKLLAKYDIKDLYGV